MVRAKMRCETTAGSMVTFLCVHEPDAEKDSENARFTLATPWGEAKMAIDNPAAREQFTDGAYYYVDFHPVP